MTQDIRSAPSRSRIPNLLKSRWTIVCVGLIVRLAFLAIPHSRTYAFTLDNPPLGLEAANIAYGLAAHQGFASPFLGMSGPTGPTAWLTPVFPWILSLIVRIFGPHTHASLLAILILNECFSAAACLPLFHAARIIGGEPMASLAAWLWTTLPMAIYVPYQAIWYIPLSALLCAALLWCTLAVRVSGQSVAWCGYGFLWGAQLLTNPSFATTIPFVLLWLAWELRKQGQHWVRLPACTALCIILACAPWTIRNYMVFHTFVPLRSNFGLEFWRFNNPKPGLHPTNSLTELQEYVKKGEIAYMKEKKEEAIQFIRAHPAQFFQTSKKRVLYFWIRGRRDGVLLAWWNLGFIVLAASGTLFLARKSVSYALIFAIFPVIFPLIYYATLASAVYRHAIEPALTLTAAAGLEGMQQLIVRCFRKGNLAAASPSPIA